MRLNILEIYLCGISFSLFVRNTASFSDKKIVSKQYEPRCEKTGLRGFRPGLTQTGLYNYRRCLEAYNFGCSKKRDCTIYVARTKALISFAVTVKLICVFVFAYAKSRFSHDAALKIIHLYNAVCKIF